MDIYRTEEEQIAAIKGWWKQYGSAIVWGLVLSLLVITGYRMYKEKSTGASEAAFVGYNTVSEAFEAASGADENSTEDKTVKTEADKVLKDHSQHIYGHLTALLLAKHHVNYQRWDAADEVLSLALSEKPTEGLRVLIKSRLARVYIEQKEYDQALTLLDSETNLHDYAAIYDELKGDIFYFKKEYEKAREAYEAALDNTEGNNNALKMKLDDLSVREA